MLWVAMCPLISRCSRNSPQNLRRFPLHFVNGRAIYLVKSGMLLISVGRGTDFK